MRAFGHDLPLLHIYGQHFYHTPATVRGNRQALEALRDAINAALEAKSGQARASVFAADGEGYGIDVHRVNTMKALGTPEYLYEVLIRQSFDEFERARRFKIARLDETERSGFMATPEVAE